MTTRLVTVKADDTLSHAANLLRQHQFHHLPVVRSGKKPGTPISEYFERNMLHLLEGLLTSQDIDLAAALAKQASSSALLRQPWQEKRVGEVMHRATMRVTPTTNVAAAAQILVERGLNCLPVVEYENLGDETQTVLVGLLTRRWRLPWWEVFHKMRHCAWEQLILLRCLFAYKKPTLHIPMQIP